MRALLVSDLVDSTRMVEALGDLRAAELFSLHDQQARELLARHQGREIDKTDGFLLLFDRPIQAAAYALAYHHLLSELARSEGVLLQARVGIHLGEVVLRTNPPEHVALGAKPLEVEGLAKPMAARLMSLAGGGQTLLTRSAFDVARRGAVDAGLLNGWGETSQGEPSPELQWLAHGPYLLKGVDEPVEVFEVGWQGLAPLAPPEGSQKARRMIDGQTVLGWRPATGAEIPGRPNWLAHEKLGEGGFGDLWLVQHRKTGDRRVLKFCYEARSLSSLKREITLFRLLKQELGERDDINRILDWRFDEAPYFIESEYTAAGSLLDWARAQGGVEQIPFATRLDLVAEVAEALAAAHSVGVLHKDVKPANVLIVERAGHEPRARLTDFGIGELTDRGVLEARNLTAAGFTAPLSSSQGGTRLYQAPELATGRPPSIQADIYSLGVMLYQLAAGDLSRSLGPGWRRDVSSGLLSADIAYCVDGSPERRPGSALEVAERLRTLESRQAQREAERRAAAETEAQHQARLVARRRRRLYKAVATVATVALAVVSLFAYWALAARDREVAARERGEGLIGYMLGDLRRQLEPIGRLEILDGIGDQAMEYFASLSNDELTDETLARRAQALRQIGDVRLKQGKLDDATAAFEQSLALTLRLVARDPERGEWRAGLADTRFWLGWVAWKQGNLAAAGEAYEAHRVAYQELVATDPARTEWQLELAYGHDNVGDVLKAQGRPRQALNHHLKSLAIFQRLVAGAPDDPDLRLELVESLHRAGKAKRALGDLRGALEHYRIRLETVQELVAQNPDHAGWRRRLLLSHSYVAGTLRRLGEAGEIPHVRRHVALARELTHLDADNTRWQRDLFLGHHSLARALSRGGSLDEALTEIQQALAIVRQLVSKEPSRGTWQQDLAVAQRQQGEILARKQQLEPAHTQVRQALAILDRLATASPGQSTTSLELARTLSLSGEILAARDDPAAAEEAHRRTLAVIEPLARDSSDCDALALWARALAETGRVAEAREAVKTLRSFDYAASEFMEFFSQRGLLP